MIENSRGILAMSASVVVFIFNDALIKLASETMPAVQAVGLRGLFATGWCVLAIAVRGEDRTRRHPAVALTYGAALALIVDEFALLLDLRDVYWAKQGRISIDLGIGGSALAGSYLAARPILRRLARDRSGQAAR